MATVKNSKNFALNPALLVSGASYSKKNRQTKNIRGWDRRTTHGYQKKEREEEKSYDYRDSRDENEDDRGGQK